MKKIVILTGFLLSVALVRAQSPAGAGTTATSVLPSSLDSSPLDMSYYPVDYPVLKIQDKVSEPLVARVVYSRPQKRGRKLFGELVNYGQVWRLGANEATEIEFFRDVKVDGKTIKKGRYTLYALVNTDRWTIIFNKENDTWGAFRYDSSKDVLRVSEQVEKQSGVTEIFSIAFQKADKGATMSFSWDDVLVKMPISWK